MQIRQIQANDNAPIAHIVRHNLEKYQLNLPGTAYFDPELDTLYQFYQKIPHAAYWVLIDDHAQVVGGVGVAPFTAKIAELQKLYLADHVKGQGYGEKLIDHALAFASEHYEGLYLETFLALKEANQLYLKKGFQSLDGPIGESGHHALDAWFLKEW